MEGKKKKREANISKGFRFYLQDNKWRQIDLLQLYFLLKEKPTRPRKSEETQSILLLVFFFSFSRGFQHFCCFKRIPKQRKFLVLSIPLEGIRSGTSEGTRVFLLEHPLSPGARRARWASHTLGKHERDLPEWDRNKYRLSRRPRTMNFFFPPRGIAGILGRNLHHKYLEWEGK